MGKLLYYLFVRLYPFFARVLALFNPKAKQWVTGRQHIFDRLQKAFADNQQPVIWIHCASLGEFEQGRPVLEALKQQHPTTKILLTFFSPSGYEIRKNYDGADWVFYLPMDSPANAYRFFNIVKPTLVLFVKYEYWYCYLSEAHKRQIPLLLVSGIFRSSQPFFQWYGGFYRSILPCFTHFFVQNQSSAQLLQSIGYSNITIAGDTRFDRVLQIANSFRPIAVIEQFCGKHTVVVAGSTWTEDDEELDHFVNTHPDIRFIIAPHDISPERIKECQTLYKHSVLFSEWAAKATPQSAVVIQDIPVTAIQANQPVSVEQSSFNIPLTTPNCLIVDNIGMLSLLYQYATICYIGGGFGGDGIHNILEAAVYYKPVVFGPVYDKYFEAVEMLEQKGAISVEDALHLEKALDSLLAEPELYNHASQQAGDYVKRNTGATEKITQYIQAKRLFTN